MEWSVREGKACAHEEESENKRKEALSERKRVRGKRPHAVEGRMEASPGGHRTHERTVLRPQCQCPCQCPCASSLPWPAPVPASGSAASLPSSSHCCSMAASPRSTEVA